MIENLTIGNFKAIRATALDLRPLNVLVGPNGAGKSSLVEALRFLHEAVVGDPSRALARWRGMVSIHHLGAPAEDPLSWSLRMRGRDDGALAEYDLEVGAEENGIDVLVRHERLARKMTSGAGNKRTLFEFNHGKGFFQDEMSKARRGARLSPRRLALHYMADLGRHAHVVPFAEDIASWRFVNPVPSLMRPPTPLGTDATWHETGMAVALQLARADSDELKTVSGRLSALVAGQTYLKPIISSEGALIQLKEQALKGLLPSWTLSDGTLRLLAILTALHIGRPPTLLCVEEPENSLHPAAIDALMEEFRQAADRGTQVIITTHSPYLLNRVVPSDESAVIWVSRPKGAAIFAPIDGNPRLKKEMERFGLGTLLEQGAIAGDVTALAANARVGLIAEGAHDLVVIADWITRLARPGLRVLPADRRRLAPKPELLRLAPQVAGALHDSGCDHVVIVWDLAAFADVKRTVEGDVERFWEECDAEDEVRRKNGFGPLERGKICPVVAVQELEAWLLADERALSSYLSRPTFPVRISKTPYPEREPNPKKRINQIFQTKGKRKPYADYVDAAPLGAKIDDLARLGKLGSFQELMSNVGA